jgi:hypothetical protein
VPAKAKEKDIREVVYRDMFLKKFWEKNVAGICQLLRT